MTTFSPQDFSQGSTAQRLQWVREAIGKILTGGQESETMGNRNQRASLNTLFQMENALLDQLARETGDTGFALGEFFPG